VLDGHSSRAEALERYGAFSDRHARKYRWMLGSQRILGRMTPSRSVTAWVRLLGNRRVSEWIFEHYLAIAPPWFVGAGPSGSSSSARASRRMPSSMAGSARLA
jgi:hypothetical protein